MASSISFVSLGAASFVVALAAPDPVALFLRPLRLRLLLEELLEELRLLLDRLLDRLLEPLFDFFVFFFFLFDLLLLFELFEERPDEELLADGLRLFEEPSSEPL